MFDTCVYGVDFLAPFPYRCGQQMKKHLYNAKLSKVRWFVKRFGATEIALKPLRTIFAPLIIPFLQKRRFPFKSEELQLFYHAYNMTWASERCVEVPIGRWYVRAFQGRRILEVGNVLAHYGAIQHRVLDKFERGPGIINEDIVDFHPPEPLDLIVSISTFEHIGFDDESELPSSSKIQAAIAACRKMLAPEGTLAMTIPIGYNPDLDDLIKQSKLGAAARYFLKRTGKTEWEPCGEDEALRHKYKTPYPYANSIMVAEFTAA